MSFICPKCSKGLKSKFGLNKHLAKSLPCDLTCRDCGYAAKDRWDYYAHRKKNPHEPPVKYTDDGPIELHQYATEDFNWEDIVTTDEEEISVTAPDGTTLRMKKIHTTRVMRSKNLQGQMSDHATMRALRSIADRNQGSVSREIAQLMYPVHNRVPIPVEYQLQYPDSPLDKNVWMMSRSSPDVNSRWTFLPHEIAIDSLASHACHLFAFLIETGYQRLIPALWKQFTVTQAVFGGTKSLILYCRDNIIEADYCANTELTVISDVHAQEAEELNRRIQDRKFEVIQRVQRLLEDEKAELEGDIKMFINRSRSNVAPVDERQPIKPLNMIKIAHEVKL